MSPELKKIASALEEYCGIRIKHENDFNFKRIVERHKLKAAPHNTNIHRSEKMLQSIVEDLVIRESYFFREPAYLELIKKRVTELSGNVRILSLGTSTGEEAYSILMYLTEHDAADRAAVFGADISRNAIKKAEAGIYQAHAMRKLDRRYYSYFTETESGFTLHSDFRKKVRFMGGFNILRPVSTLISGIKFDIITARNFFIYHDRMIEKILTGILALIKAEGVLVTTPVEFHKLNMLTGREIKVIAI